MTTVAAPVEPDRAEHVRVESNAGPLWLPRSDTVMSAYIRRRGAWDETGAGLLQTLVRGNFSLLDVGAGVGYHSILAWRTAPGVSVDCVEAGPRALPLLRWNLWVNGVHQPQVHPVALGTAPDAASAVVRGDEYFSGRRFDVVRIDLGGGEAEALHGLVGVLRTSPRVAVMVAFWPHLLRRRGADPHDVLRGYRDIGMERRVVVSHDPLVMSDDDVVLTCDNAGPTGRVNLLLR